MAPHVQAFIDKFACVAFENEEKRGVPALFELAQGALESAWGQKTCGNNYFGIKAANWSGKTRVCGTTEYEGGGYVPQDAKFRDYDTPEDSWRDHAKFFHDNSRYHHALKTKDPYEFALRVAQAGYATDPQYYNSLANTMNSIKAYVESKRGSCGLFSLGGNKTALYIGAGLVAALAFAGLGWFYYNPKSFKETLGIK